MKKMREFKGDAKDLLYASRPVPSTIDYFFTKAGPWIILTAALMILFLIFQLNRTNERLSETEAYTRVTNCIVAKSALIQPTQDEIERCYIQVEKNSGLSLERFDVQTKGEN